MTRSHRTPLAGLVLGIAAATLFPTAAQAVKPAFSSEVTITVENGVRIIKSNGVPNHETGQFPGAGNPNTIGPQKYEYHVPAEPKVAAEISVRRMQPFGVAVNGVVFDPGAAEWWNGDRSWQYEPLKLAPLYLGTDASHAHVQPNGAYHYHGIPTALVFALTDGKQKMVIVGWAADGFPIYNHLGHSDPKDAKSPLKTLKSSYAVKKGTRPGGPGGAYDGKFVADYEYVAGSGDLDECNGLVSVTPEYPNGVYHYVLTDDFPYIPRMYRGTPDPSFERRGQGGGPDAPRGGPRGNGRPGSNNGGSAVAPGGGFPSGANGGVHVIPPFAASQMNLTPEQQALTDALEKEARARLEKILTPEQMKQLDAFRPFGGGRPGNGGAGGAAGGPPSK